MKMDKALYQQIFEQHQERLHNLDASHPKIVITFSAIAGSGKTTLAKAIERKYSAVRISNDHVRRIIDGLDLGIDPPAKQQLLEQYVLRLFDYLSKQANGLVLLDSSIDRKYFAVKERVEPLGYRMVFIKITLPRAEIERRVRERHKSAANPDAYLREFDRWVTDNERLAAQVDPDITLADNYTFDFDNVYKYLDQLLV